jgi:hypothetical protein
MEALAKQRVIHRDLAAYVLPVIVFVSFHFFFQTQRALDRSLGLQSCGFRPGKGRLRERFVVLSFH